MSIYPAHRAIFVHVPKTGGSTISTLLRHERLLGLKRNDPDPRTHKHATLFEHMAALGDEADDYFKFSFVRNPWDRLVSAYHYVVERRTGEFPAVAAHKSFADFAAAISRRPEEFLESDYFRPQSSFLIDDAGNMPLDFLGKYETFEDDLQTVLTRLGIRRTLMQHRKRSKHSDYREYYDAGMRDAIAEIYRKDLEAFGYEFDDGQKRGWSFFIKLLGRSRK